MADPPMMLLFAADSEFWARFASIVMLDLMLAGDNAILIALAVRTLPPREQFLGRVWGTVGAVVLRLVFIALVSVLLKVPLLQFAGGVLLLWVGYKLVWPRRPGAHAGDVHAHGSRSGSNLSEAVKIIILADVSMSLDNVLAIAGTAHGDMTLVVFGIALSIPLVVWGSALLSKLMARFVWIIWLGGGVLGYVAGDLIIKDPTVRVWIGADELPGLRSVPWALGIGMAFLGVVASRRARPAALTAPES
jgi:YjbE family integral membrane protein